MIEPAKKVFRHVNWRCRLGAKRTLNRTVKLYWRNRRKKITAMIRVKNEAEFLSPSVLSMAHLVDEIVIIDNLSTDKTPEVAARLKRDLSAKVQVYAYPHEVARMGEDYHALQRKDANSPGLLHNYYNWCLSKCQMPFIMKWDGDMIAMDEFASALEKFKTGGFLQFDFGGHNISSDQKKLLVLSAVIEPRVFPKLLTKFSYQGADCESLGTWVVPEKTLVVEEPLYLHMKYCKASPTANFSPRYGQEFESKLQTAGPLPAPVVETLAKWLAHPPVE